MTNTKINGYNVQVLKAGLLLGLHVKVDGARQYTTRDLDSEVSGDTLRRSWVGECVVFSREEADASDKVRSKCRQAITRCCVQTEFGPLCPADRIEDLWAAVQQARAAADTWNDTARYARIRISMMPAILGDPDALDPATRERIMRESDYALAAEMRSMLGDIQAQFGKLESDPAGTVKRIRAIARDAMTLSKTMADKQGDEARAAIEAAREAATAITRRAVKLGENLSSVLGDLDGSFKQVEAGRFAALDLEQSIAPESSIRMSAVDLARFAGLDLDPEAQGDGEKAPAVAAAPAADFELPPENDAPEAPAVRAPARAFDMPDPEPDDDDLEEQDSAPAPEPVKLSAAVDADNWGW